MLTGEYFVLDGAKALAIPLRLGQSMHVRESAGSELIWQSQQPSGEIWFSAKFDLLDFDYTEATDDKTARTLKQILKAACRLNSDFLSKWKKYRVDTYLEFDRQWGLGSSSTLIACIADWADVSAYQLLFNTLGGSGYDIACAHAEGPILYQLGEEELHITHIDFKPSFTDQLYFVYLGTKKSTEPARKLYYKRKGKLNGALRHISEISEAVTQSTKLADFEKALREHEEIVAKSLKLSTVKNERFEDYWGTVKSLGAWGGDFVLATSDRDAEETKAYFRSKGLDTIFPYADLALA